jgi:DNA-binding LacI/PurR family transcriptional regulator
MQGARPIADHFYALGRRRAAFVGGRPGSSTNQERQQAFVTRLAELGMTLTACSSTDDFSYDADYRSTERIAAAGSTDAVFFASNILATGAMDRLRDEFTAAIPGEVSVAGFEGIEMAGWPHYPLTTFRYPADAMVNLSVRLLTECPDVPGGRGNVHRPSGKLVMRNSTGRQTAGPGRRERSSRPAKRSPRRPATTP